MKNKDPYIYLHNILDFIVNIQDHLLNISKSEFHKSMLIQDAVIRKIELIGEAVKNLPSGIKTNYPEVSWQSIAGMRDKLVHDYLGIDIDLVWGVATRDLITLEKRLFSKSCG